MVDKQLLLNKITDEYPELRWKESKYITNGWDYDIVVLDDRIVFRFPKGQLRVGNLMDEANLLMALGERISLPIPQYTFIPPRRDFAGYSVIKGEQFKPWRYKKLSGTEKADAAKKLALFITELHATPTSLVKRYHIEAKDEPKLLREIRVNAKRYVYPRISHYSRAIIEDFFKTIEEEMVGHKPNRVLIHQDLLPDNILLRSGSISGIIDFSDCKHGDPAYDFAGLWNYGPKFVRSVYRRYGGKKDNRLLYRSKLIYQLGPIFIMTSSFLGYPCTFKQGYRMFKKRFLL
ncbi:MAG: hypothetical protein A2Y84_01385 [Candidatus Colwellbacteria bacterium RBG_13_48_8]|uniref:Aminoglycoside phosphotransferase domain-containing protein n=1 Tax=Candidatus Colwellbacteria bacterium RBG_13_48_8 TaxID=1797685 RepID=A0A1G1YZ96_9BACT|nr:MAG: hypothetical protein A2Y84_01385 [Candidatus Colwellbacteria bacterium RBG_13_48_8]